MQAAYPFSPHLVPADNRDVINRGIVKMIRDGKNPNRDKVFHGFTGKGGLSGLKSTQFDSFRDYTEAKRKIEQGQFLTPPDLCKLITDIVNPKEGALVADLTCGSGNFFNSLGHCRLYGCELDDDAAAVARYLYPGAKIETDDIRSYDCPMMDHIVGNPPFLLTWVFREKCPATNEKNETRSETFFLWKAARSLKHGGTLAMICPERWLKDELTDAKSLKIIENDLHLAAEIPLPHDCFRAYGCESFAMKILVFLRCSPGDREMLGETVQIDGTTLTYDAIREQWGQVSGAFYTCREKLRYLRSQVGQERSGSENTGYTPQYQFRKYLHQLRRMAPAEVDGYLDQWDEAHKPKPHGVDYEQWEKTRLKPETVVKRIKARVQAENVTPHHTIRLVRTKHGFMLKAYSRQAKVLLRGMRTSLSDKEAIQGDRFDLSEVRERIIKAANREKNPINVTLEAPDFAPLIAAMSERFRRDFLPMCKTLTPELLQQVKKEAALLEPFGITPIEKQVEIVARALYKPGAFLRGEMGTGKTIMGILWDNVLSRTNKGQTLIICHSIALGATWSETFDRFGTDYQICRKRRDWQRAGAKFMATPHQVQKNKKLIKRLIRQGIIGRVIVDESHEMIARGKLGRAVRDVAALCPRRLLMTGTPVLNTMTEAFDQLDVVFGNAFGFECEATTYTYYDRKAGMFKVEENRDHYGQRYTPYRGLGLFRKCHVPSKPTVFGENRNLPEVLNRQALSVLFDRVSLSVTLKELSGREMISTETVPVEMTRGQSDLYEDAFENISRYVRDLSTESRKENLMLIAQKIMILQKITSCPSMVAGGEGVASGKFERIEDMSRESAARHLAVGCIWKESVERLADHLRANTDREVFSFDGSQSVKARRQLIRDFEKSPYAVLVCTQQSIRSSISIPFVDEAIVESLPWNLGRLRQWAARFARLTSENPVRVKALVCLGTLEERILGLTLKKEVVSQFALGYDGKDVQELYGEYGVNPQMLSVLVDYLLDDRDAKIQAQKSDLAHV